MPNSCEKKKIIKKENLENYQQKMFWSMQNKLDKLYTKVSDANISKFAEIVASPRKIFLRSFLAGIARGIGSAIGFSILGAVLIYLFRYIVMLNLPVIGAFVKDIWEIIQKQ